MQIGEDQFVALIQESLYHYTFNRLPASRLLLPRSGLERSDFVLWYNGRAAAAIQIIANSEVPLLATVDRAS